MSKSRVISLWVVFFLGASFPLVASAVLVFSFQVGNSVPPGVDGDGFVTLDESTGDLEDFSLLLTAQGSLFDGTSTEATEHVFSYGIADVIAVVDLMGGAQGLSGRIDLATKTATNGAVVIGGFMNDGALSLNFTTGLVSGFCIDAIGGAQCIAGGGSSTHFEANVIKVPAPPTMPLFAAAVLALLGCRYRAARLRMRDSGGLSESLS